MGAAPNPRALTGRSGTSSHGLRFPLRAFLRFPGCPPGSSPSSAFLWFPFVWRSPVRSLRPLPGSGSPSVSLRVPFPLGNLHVSAAAGRFRGRRSRAAGTKVTSSAATTSPGSRDPPALQMAAPGHDGMPPQNRLLRAAAERRTSPRPNRSGGYFARAPKTQVALRDRLPVSLRPRMAAFTAADYMGMAEVSRRAHGARPCPRHDGALGLDWLAPRS